MDMNGYIYYYDHKSKSLLEAKGEVETRLRPDGSQFSRFVVFDPERKRNIHFVCDTRPDHFYNNTVWYPTQNKVQALRHFMKKEAKDVLYHKDKMEYHAAIHTFLRKEFKNAVHAE